MELRPRGHGRSVDRSTFVRPKGTRTRQPTLFQRLTSFAKGEYCYEESSFRGAFCFSTSQADTRVYARPREIGRRTIRVYRFYCNGLRQSARWRKSLRFERRQPGCGNNHGRWTQPPKSRPQALTIADKQPVAGWQRDLVRRAGPTGCFVLNPSYHHSLSCFTIAKFVKHTSPSLTSCSWTTQNP